MISSRVTAISASSFCNDGIKIVGKPSVVPNVSKSKFLALTANTCGNACRNLDISNFSLVPFASTDAFIFPCLQVIKIKYQLLCQLKLQLQLYIELIPSD